MRGHTVAFLAVVLLAGCPDDPEVADGTETTGGPESTGASTSGDTSASTGGSDGPSTSLDDTGTTDGTGGPPSFDVLDIVFPPPSSLTDAASIVVRGTVTPADSVQSVTVAGVEAVSSDGFAHWWSGDIALALGDQTLTAEAVDHANTPLPDLESVDVRREDFLPLQPGKIALDPVGDRAFTTHTIDNAILVVETSLTTGSRRVVSGGTTGSGTSFDFIAHGLIWDAAEARLLLLSEAQLFSVDPMTGARTVLASTSMGAGAWPDAPFDAVLDAAADRVLVSDDGTSRAILAIDLTTGNRTILSDDDNGTGPSFNNPYGLAMDPDNGRVLVADALAGLVAVDLSTGDRTQVSDQWALAILAYDAAGARAFAGDAGFLYEIDVTDGSATLMTGTLQGVGSGVEALRLQAIAFDGANVLGVDLALDAIIAVDPSTGDRSFVSSMSIGTGPILQQPMVTGWDTEGSRVVVYDWGRYLLVDPADGSRTVLSDLFTGRGPGFTHANDIVVVGGLAYSANTPEVLRIDLSSGDRTIVTSTTVGSGPALAITTHAIASDSTASMLWVLDAVGGRVLSVDPDTGDRAVVSDDGTGAGPSLVAATGALLYDGSSLFVAIPGTVFEVDPTSGDRTIVSGIGVGSGPGMGLVHAAMLDDPGSILVGSTTALLRIDIATGDRTILSDGSTGSGPLGRMGGWTRSDDGIAWAIHLDSEGLVAVDPGSGHRVIVSK